ncbi:hypothetical protein ASNO1_26260 [Corallococcus caeni]|uniref:Peptidase S8/S53 domain-containing protein n=1 Tax=Corallococcus caeni TaxID=3082388 RepID=A0ABQ6QSV7_9BACT|nr:hypothetical protein ASNO1_26260 [Corallococcus sp. NO1]
MRQYGEYTLVGTDTVTNAYQGDTTINTFLPALCLKKDGRPAPSGITYDYYQGWAGGEVKLTRPFPASVLTSAALADTLCEEEFGAGYRMAEFHDGDGGWNFWAEGTLGTSSRFWVAINNQPANPWNSSGAEPPPPVPPKFIENNNALPGRFLVLFPDSTDPAGIPTLSQSVASEYGGTVEAVFQDALFGFTFLGSEAQARALSEDSRVESVEQDSVSSEIVDPQNTAAPQGLTSQYSPNWGLDRIDQRARPYDNQYSYENTGAGVNVYVLDTGIHLSHQEFGGRASQPADFISRTNTGNTHCDNHGTGVASIIGGQTVGVAKQVRLYSVRIADCEGVAYNSRVSLFTTTIIAGMDWVTRNHVKPAVANISYGQEANFLRRWAGTKTSMDKAVARAIAKGIIVVVAAGNERHTADRSSPARLEEALTVAGSAWNDSRYSESNWGPKIDLFAPGEGVRIASMESDTAITYDSGTSYAAPYVTGAVAMYLQGHPTATPAQVAAALINNATQGIITDTQGSPNRLLHTLYPPVGPNDVGVLSGSGSCPDPAKRVTISLDNEDSNQASRVNGWTGATSVDSNGNTHFVFCRTDGNQFHSLSAGSDGRSNFAVLQLGGACPAGSVGFARYFDNEDSRNSNSYSGEIAPNVVDGNTLLRFCLFKGDGVIAAGLPVLGFDYGVFAGTNFVFTSSRGSIYTDDEDSRNKNYYSADPAWKYAATAIVSEGANTTLFTARAAFTACGDNVCNGMENDNSCAVDCDRCGNGTCSVQENTNHSCWYDCGSCGDGLCGYGENAYNCADCRYCGDGICSAGESDCTEDCGGTTTCGGTSAVTGLRLPPCEPPVFPSAL